MLRIGLTGGIGSGKSTVARRLVERGAVLIDSDAMAREVVAGGTPGLAQVVEEFGESVLGPDGELDRPALARVVFGDEPARARLNGIIHPLVRRRSAELSAAAPADAVVVNDIPLLVEVGAGSGFPLVVVVHADAETRLRRLVEQRGMPEDDARARMAAQADDAARRAAADVWLDNSGRPEDLHAAVDALFGERLVPFEENVRLGRVAATDGGSGTLLDPDAAERVVRRIAAAAGEHGRGVEHVGSASVTGSAEGPVRVQLGVDRLADADAIGPALLAAGLPAVPVAAESAERAHGAADPGQAVDLRIREVGSPGWREELLLRDWARAVPEARERLRYGARHGDHDEVSSPSVLPDAEKWAVSSGWAPSLG